MEVGRAEDERLIALVASPVEQGRRFGVGARHDDPGHLHDVELEARRAEALDLLVLGDEHLAALVPALLHAGLLILDVIAGHAHLDEAAHQVPHVRVAAVSGVGVGDDEGAKVDGLAGLSLLLGHASAREVLVLVGGEERADDRRRLVGHLAQRIAREIRTGVLLGGALGARRPSSEIDRLDARALHRHGLARRVRAERGDALLLGEELAESCVEGRGGLARDGVVGADRPALLDDLSRRVESFEPGEPGALEPLPHLADLSFDRHPPESRRESMSAAPIILRGPI